MADAKIIIVAQAETADAAHDAAAETHATTEVAGGHETGGQFPPFDASTFPSQLLWLALTFGFLYLAMSRMALPRIGGILESRRLRIEGDLKEAERLRSETERAAAAYEAALLAARANAHAIAEETRSGIKADLDGKRSKVEADLAGKVAAAEGRIQKSKEAALANVDEIAADTAAVLVERLAVKVTQQQARDAVASVLRG